MSMNEPPEIKPHNGQIWLPPDEFIQPTSDNHKEAQQAGTDNPPSADDVENAARVLSEAIWNQEHQHFNPQGKSDVAKRSMDNHSNLQEAPQGKSHKSRNTFIVGLLVTGAVAGTIGYKYDAEYNGGKQVKEITKLIGIDSETSNKVHVQPTPTTTETAKSHPSANPTPTTTVSTPKTLRRFMPTLQPDGSVKGASAIFDYKGVTVDQVAEMEYCGNYTDSVLLTFNGSGSPKQIQNIANTLKKNNTGAIFFPNSDMVKQPIVDNLRTQGFWVGNHTAKKQNLVPMSEIKMKGAIKSGGKSDLLRPPYAGTLLKGDEIYFDGRVKDAAKAVGKRVCMYTVDSGDWKKFSSAKIDKQVLNQIKPGSVVSMDMSDGLNTLGALPKMIEGIRAKGLNTCKIQKPTSSDIPAKLPC